MSLSLNELELGIIQKALKVYKSQCLAQNSKLRSAILDIEHLPNEQIIRAIDSINSRRNFIITYCDNLLSKLEKK